MDLGKKIEELKLGSNKISLRKTQKTIFQNGTHMSKMVVKGLKKNNFE